MAAAVIRLRDPTGPWQEIAPPPPGGGPAAWTPSTVYNTGDRVTYQATPTRPSEKPGDPNAP
ncbi:hypothetical protein [Dactylosporangium sp. CA-092794]|uniref:hypothetical protein n=1 Tax=Dactylosporangium sp. CA-092794 TaxID=3239929 RepID=UPI003D8F0EC4